MQVYLEKVQKTVRYHFHNVHKGLRAQWWDLRKPRAQAPIFVIGCSRAGTTLVYRTLSESEEIGSMQRESHDFWAALHPLSERNWDSHAISAEKAGDADRDFVTRYFFAETGNRRFVDKNNQNGLSVPYLKALFPDAYFVNIKRSPGDNINSLIEGWRRPGEFATWSDNLPLAVNVDGGDFQRWCFFLAAGWRDLVSADIEDVCAFQYTAMNRAIIEAGKSVAADHWIEIRYEDLLQDPVTGFKQAFDACGLSFTPHLQKHCSNVLKKPYNAFSEIKLDKWKSSPNQEKIARVLPGLAELAKEMGYAV